jgi:antitoxin component HigA of HigAB toxin-antitoxin module
MPSTIRHSAADSYMELIAEFPLRRIKTAAEHARAKAIILRMTAQKTDRGASDYLEVLVDLVADFERRSEYGLNSSNISASDLVRHRIAERKMSVNSLAKLIGVPQPNLFEMLNGKRGWSKTAIRGLSTILNIRADRFLA